jgi:hypothetical protein
MKVGKVAPHTLVIAVLAVLLMVVSASAQAQTPDGLPPPNEGVCDGLHNPGVTPGLYGLCVAYCEALDCEHQEGQPPQCAPANRAILDQYNRLRNDADPTMPCIQPPQVPCPCWDAQQIAAIGFGWPGSSVYWYPNATPAWGYTSDGLIEVLPGWTIQQGVFVSQWAPSPPACLYYRTAPGEGIWNSYDISASEADVCRAQIEQQRSLLQASSDVTLICAGNACPQ